MKSDPFKATIVNSWTEALTKETATWVEILVVEESHRMLKRSDMDKLLDLVEVLPADLVVVEQTGELYKKSISFPFT